MSLLSDIHIDIPYSILDYLINELNNHFSNESLVIFCDISALYSGGGGGNTFLFIEDLKDQAATYSLYTVDLQREIPFVKKLLLKQLDYLL